jgi:multidrug efflux pump subunit AcrB
VVAISLLLSWVLSVTITPLMCIWLLPDPDGSVDEQSMYGGRMYVAFRNLLNQAIRFRYAVVAGLLACLIVSLYSFQFVDRTFFPDSARLQVMLEYWAPQGTKIQTVSADIQRVEQRLMGDEKVASVSTFMGQGPPRFYLPVDPEKAYQSYAQVIVNVHDLKGLNQLIPEMES